MRLKLTISYDGSDFAGWQSQSHGRGIQDCLEKALASIAGHRLILHAAGRTDAGVHALAQCAHVDVGEVTGKMKNPQRWLTALNAALPPTIRILKIKQVSSNFHARFSSHQKIYRYLLWNGTVLPPLLHRRAWHLYGILNFTLLRRLAQEIEGRHDFRGFTAKSGATRENTKRTYIKSTSRNTEMKFLFPSRVMDFFITWFACLLAPWFVLLKGKCPNKNFSNASIQKNLPSLLIQLQLADFILLKFVIKNSSPCGLPSGQENDYFLFGNLTNLTMRLLLLILFCGYITQALADPTDAEKRAAFLKSHSTSTTSSTHHKKKRHSNSTSQSHRRHHSSTTMHHKRKSSSATHHTPTLSSDTSHDAIIPISATSSKANANAPITI